MKDLLFKKYKLHKKLFFLIFIFILTFVMDVMLRGEVSDSWNYVNEYFSRFLFNVSIILLTFTPCFLFKKRYFYIYLITTIWLILSIANSVILNLRGTPLTGGDLKMIKSGLSIAKQYLTNFNILCIGLLLVVILVSLVIIYIKSPKSNVRYKIVVPSILIYGLAFSQILNFVLDKGIVTTNFFDVRARYMDYGFSYSFLNSIVNNGVKKPSSYSKSSIDTLEYALGATDSMSTSASVMDVKCSENQTNVEPNIIMIQLESFIDPLWIETIDFSEDPIPNFRNIFNNYTSGLLTIPGLGGGTANSEFEVITGFSSSLFGAGEFPFNTLLSSDTSPSLAYYLKNLGYSSHALHNNDATFYSRYTAYKNLGFNTFTPMECMPNMDRTPMGWAKDSYLTYEIEKLLTNTDNADLIFAVSVQGHGSYPNSPLEDSVIKVSSNNQISNLNSIEYYVNQLYEMDKFIGELIDMVNSLNEPSIVVFYGDHHPAIDVKAEDFVTNSLYTTPYAIWNNIGLEKESINLKAYELSSYILKTLNFPETILTTLHNSTIDTELKEEYLHLIQYDSLYGKDYLGLNESITSNDSFSYGVNIPIINNIESSSDSTLNIIGENFNSYSKVFVNDNAIDSTFIDSNTLSLGNYKLKAGDIITVRDMTVSGKIELLSSLPFEY